MPTSYTARPGTVAPGRVTLYTMTWLSLSKPALYGCPSEIPCVVMKSLSA